MGKVVWRERSTEQMVPDHCEDEGVDEDVDEDSNMDSNMDDEDMSGRSEALTGQTHGVRDGQDDCKNGH